MGATPTSALPTIIQGGMGVAVSSWQLAQAVARSGQLGVVSGTALDCVLARRLQDGDPDGSSRRALAHFPDQAMAKRILKRYFIEGGRSADKPYRPIPKFTIEQENDIVELNLVGNFVEVWLAKEGHDGLVGINYLEKIQMSTPSAALGAMMAGVDYVLMGAGIPREIPQLLNDFAAGRPGGVSIEVHGADHSYRVEVDPQKLLAVPVTNLKRPQFLAIVSAAVLAMYLARDESTRPEGFVVEGYLAGGHNAPPRAGMAVLDENNEPTYGPKDEVEPAKIAAIGLPFWLAGSYGTPEKVAAAKALGAAGVQVGTLFALADESGFTPEMRARVRTGLADDSLVVRTDALASPTGFPFKVVQLDDSLSNPEVYAERERICDLGFLREVYLDPKGKFGYRCASEPVHMFVKKGGDVAETTGRQCLCNALSANVGKPQLRIDGYVERPLLTLGSDLSSARELTMKYPDGWSATDVVEWLMTAV
jgi:NAD(P)H-dependent flavin oxidoreductase YrpB (nitropropane dioxygenase family)